MNCFPQVVMTHPISCNHPGPRSIPGNIVLPCANPYWIHFPIESTNLCREKWGISLLRAHRLCGTEAIMSREKDCQESKINHHTYCQTVVGSIKKFIMFHLLRALKHGTWDMRSIFIILLWQHRQVPKNHPELQMNTIEYNRMNLFCLSYLGWIQQILKHFTK